MTQSKPIGSLLCVRLCVR